MLTTASPMPSNFSVSNIPLKLPDRTSLKAGAPFKWLGIYFGSSACFGTGKAQLFEEEFDKFQTDNRQFLTLKSGCTHNLHQSVIVFFEITFPVK